MYRYGIISTASIVGRFVEGLRLAGDEVVAIASRDMSKARSLADKLGIPECYDRYEDIYNHPDVDIVYIPVINFAHYPCAKAALEAGKHVVLEKPFTLTPEQAMDLQQTAARNHCFLMEGVKNLFMPSTEFIKEHLPKIGDILLVSTRQGTKVPFPEGHWMLDFEKSGGALMGSSEYGLQYLLYLFGGHAEKMQGQFRTNGKTDTDCVFTYMLGNTMVCSAILMSGDTDNLSVIYGTLGRIEIDHFWRSHDVKVILNDGQVFEFHDSGNEFVYECRHIQHCIAQGLLESPELPLSRSIEVVGYTRRLYKNWDFPKGAEL